MHNLVKLSSPKDRRRLIEAARTYVGVPFRHRGRNRHGIDCAGLIVESVRDCGYNPPDIYVYGREPEKDGLREILEQGIGRGARYSARHPIEGDVALIAFDGNTPQHVAWIADSPTGKGRLSLIHSYGTVGKVVEHGYDQSWIAKTVAIFRFEIDTSSRP